MSFSYNGQPQGVSGGINAALHSSLIQLIDQMTQRLDFPTKQTLMTAVNTNPQVINGLHAHMVTGAASMGVNMRMGQSMHPQDMVKLLEPWLTQAVGVIRGLQNQGQAPAVGFVQPGSFAPQSPNAMYASGAPQVTQDYIPPTPAPPVAVQQQQTPQRNTVVSLKKVVSSMQIDKLEFKRDALDDETRLDRNKGLELVGTPMVATWNQTRVSYATFKSIRIEDGVFDAYRDLDTLLPDGMKRGFWTYRLIYTEVNHIPLDTNLFLGIRERVRACFVEEKWRGVLTVLQDTTQGVWTKIDAYLTNRINVLLETRLRSSDHLGLAIGIQTIRDLVELCDPHFDSPIALDPRFPGTLEHIINSVMKETFIHDTAVVPDKNEMTPLMKCRAVDYFNGSTTKFDYGVLPQDAREVMLKSIFAANTVLKLPRVLLATNSVQPDAIECLSDPNFMGIPSQLGLFEQVSDLMLADDIPLPDKVILNRPRVAPSEWLNIVKPIYPMGAKSTHLVGSNRLIGW